MSKREAANSQIDSSRHKVRSPPPRARAPRLSITCKEPPDKQENREADRHLLEKQRHKERDRGRNMLCKAPERRTLRTQEHPESEHVKKPAARIAQRGNPCRSLHPLRMRRPKQGCEECS